MLIDANLLLYARDRSSPFHAEAAAWLTSVLNGMTRVGLPWVSLVAFVRIATHPRAYERPLSPAAAWQQVRDWLDAGPSWTPAPTTRHADLLGELVERHDLRGNLVSDAHIAALAIEHGLEVCSADSDFARFREIRWFNPVAR
jgi:toxin-antitoxin system PIN domain toxin